MKNILKLHEAIAVVLLSKPKRMATFETIAKEINKRGLYFRKDGEPLPAYQVMMRSKLSKSRYDHLFQYLQNDKVKLL
jgi:uncharacterized protein YjiK